jgi:hypothetical protein
MPKAVTEETRASGSTIQEKFGHWVVRVENEERWAIELEVDTSHIKWVDKSGGWTGGCNI